MKIFIKIIITNFLIIIIGSLLIVVESDVFAESKKIQVEEFAAIQKEFPNSLNIVSKSKNGFFEFCPDNTCDLLKANKPITIESLSDIGYLYIYYFSDYLELDKWRKREKSFTEVQKILQKKKYARCEKYIEDRKKAICILRSEKLKFNVDLYFVRYDEKKKYMIKKSMF